MNVDMPHLTSWLGTGSINLFGRPFSGKDTQGRVLADLFDAPLIGGGDILRSHSDYGHIKELMASGSLAPSDKYEEIVVPYLSNPEFHGKPLILSTVGRAHGEEEIIVRATSKADHPLKAVVLLNLSEDEVWRRFENKQGLGQRGNRADDTKESLENRLKKYRELTIPVIDYYRSAGLLIEIDGSLPVAEVTATLLAELSHLAQR